MLVAKSDEILQVQELRLQWGYATETSPQRTDPDLTCSQGSGKRTKSSASGSNVSSLLPQPARDPGRIAGTAGGEGGTGEPRPGLGGADCLLQVFLRDLFSLVDRGCQNQHKHESSS